MSKFIKKSKDKNKYIEENNNKGKFQSSEYLYLQNIEYDYLNSKDIKTINFNYVLNHMFFQQEKTYIKRVYNINESINIIDTSNKLIKAQIPNELKNYKDTIKIYCESAKLDIVSNDFKLELDENHKLIVGLGHQNIIETSMTIHKIYGVPYIPGQALKGVFRNYIEKLEHKKYDDNKQLIKSLFSEEQRSGIHFFDSYPEDRYTIDTDVINVHHQKYYSGNGEPNGEEKLIPVNFYVVKDTIFPILFALEDERINRVIENCKNEEKWQGKSVEDIKRYIYVEISNLVYEAYTILGIGAKTNVGYGFGKIRKGDAQKTFDKRLKKKLKLEKEQKVAKMNKVKRIIYNIEKNTDKNKIIADVIKTIENDFDKDEQSEIAKYIKAFYERKGKWKLKRDKKGSIKKNDKMNKRIQVISNILKTINKETSLKY